MKHLILFLFAASLWGQTSGITTSGNLRSGSGSPEGSVSAPVGTVYQRTDGSTGTSLYVKESGSGNTGWVAVAASAGGSGTFQSLITDLKVTRTTGTQLDFAPGMCWDTAKSGTLRISITGGSGNGSWVAYCNDAGAIVVLHSTSAGLTVTKTGVLETQVTTPEIPEGAQPIAEGTITSGNWDDPPTDLRTWSLGNRHINGTGMNVVCATGACTHNIDTAVVQTKTDTLTTSGAVDVTGATRTEVFREATSDPGTCSGTEVWRRTDTGELKHCVGGVATVIGGSAPTITSDLYWPFGYGSTDTSYNPGANVQRAYKFTPLANYTFSKIRYRVSGTGYVSFAIYAADGNSKVTNSTALCNNNSAGGAGLGYQCDFAGNVSLTAGTSYYFVFTADASTGIYVTHDNAGSIGYAGTAGFAPYVGTAANSSTGSGASLALSATLGTISAHTSTIAGNQLPGVVFIP